MNIRNNMLHFDSYDELINNRELKELVKHGYKKVMLEDKFAVVCDSDEYDDIIWGGIHDTITELNERYELNIDACDFASRIRDNIINLIGRKYNTEFIEMIEEY